MTALIAVLHANRLAWLVVILAARVLLCLASWAIDRAVAASVRLTQRGGGGS